ncbi:MAG: ester cyclase [bacterium]
MNISTKSGILKLAGILLATCILIDGCRQSDPSQELKPLIDAYVKAWNTGDFSGLDKVVSPQFELRMTPRFDAVRSLDSLKQTISYWRTAYPDFTIQLDEVVYGKNAAAVRWTIRATNTGPGSSPPTGKTVFVPGISIFHFANGQIIDEWIASNNLYWMQQLGFALVPPDNPK